ncbi:DUF4388 domain-containing protein [Deinococcus sedimenti]|uniref:PatA-like N-terminal domain-containing protein n=1 Tax=Deinococcus sedimenti TaxID=1867090 RepID=A0ABQ2S3L0_9DEIO|nr:DUF4388 domain-containing protein [Deinococcus sedimenti]GGR85124.1 hypothetical protein GCM10008960_10210 [Deinococcus sedimenti]
MAERLQQLMEDADARPTGTPREPARILFLSDTLPPLGQYLRERSTFLATCEVIDVSTQADALREQTPPDLVVLQVAPGRTPSDQLITHAQHHWPFTAFSVDADHDLSSLTEQHGVMTTLAAPNLNELHAAIEHEVTELSFGAIRGVTLPSLLQILHWEQRTLAVKVQEGEHRGYLHLCRGELVDATEHPGGLTGEDAAFALLSFQHPHMQLERSYLNQRRNITTPLTNLLMEAMKRLDEHPAPPPTDNPALLEDSMFFKRWLKSYGEPTPQDPTGSPDPPDQPAAAPSPDSIPSIPEVTDMSNVKEILDSAMGIDGALAAALVDYSSGMALGTAGGGMNLELAAAGNTEVVRAKLRTMDSLGIKGPIEDILITLDNQYHIIYVIPQLSMFLYLVLSKERANLAMARFKLKGLAGTMAV